MHRRPGAAEFQGSRNTVRAYPEFLNFCSNHSFFFECRTLNNNNLTWLGKDMFSNMFRLRTLRLSDNLLHCDCQLSWLARYLRHSPRLAQYTRCHSPNHLKGQNIADLQDQEFKCSGKSLQICLEIHQWKYKDPVVQSRKTI